MPMITWYCPAWVNVPFTHLIFSISFVFAFFSSARTNRILVMQWDTAEMFSLPPISSRSSFTSSVYFAMIPLLFCVSRYTCLNKSNIAYLFKQVNTLFPVFSNLFKQVCIFFLTFSIIVYNMVPGSDRIDPKNDRIRCPDRIPKHKQTAWKEQHGLCPEANTNLSTKT